jgi:hypothetical protein
MWSSTTTRSGCSSARVDIGAATGAKEPTELQHSFLSQRTASAPSRGRSRVFRDPADQSAAVVRRSDQPDPPRGDDPFSGHVFVFLVRRKNQIKLPHIDAPRENDSS